jgi:hypothetical protein
MDFLLAIFKKIFDYFNELVKISTFKNLLPKNDIKVCEYCNNCNKIFLNSKKKKKISCVKCKQVLNHFYWSSFIKYIEKNFEDLKKNIEYNESKDILEDYSDGIVYKNLLKKYNLTMDDHNMIIFVSLNTDGFVSNLDNNSIYPFFLSIVNINKKLRLQKKYNFLTCIFKKKKKLEVPFYHINSMIINELEKLQKGIKIKDVNVKVFLLNILVDLPCKSKFINLQILMVKIVVPIVQLLESPSKKEKI